MRVHVDECLRRRQARVDASPHPSSAAAAKRPRGRDRDHDRDGAAIGKFFQRVR
jgi:hypothetical protein